MFLPVVLKFLMDKKDKNSSTPERNYERLDPLGEIRRYAKQMWVEAGKPDDKDPLDYFDEAEQLLVGGRSSSAPSGRIRHLAKGEGVNEQLSGYVQGLIEQSENKVLSVVAESLRRELSAHDAVCLATILKVNELQLKDGSSIGPLKEVQISGILAALTNEYDHFFLEQMGTSDFHSISIGQRLAYWQQRLEDLQKVDKPLSFHDLNTISRLEGEMISHGRIAKLINRSSSPELA